MNNASLSLDDYSDQPKEDVRERLRSEESRLLRIIEALQSVQQTKEWSTLKNEVFDTLVNTLEKELRVEARKDDPAPAKLTRLNGELKWAEKFSDLTKLENKYRVELQNIRLKYGKESE